MEGMTRKLPDPFIVIATQNPVGSSGTQMLPESQLDRFIVCLSVGYPKHEDAVALLKGEVWTRVQNIEPVLSLEELVEIQKKTQEIFVHDSIYEYIVSLIEETRSNPLFSMGASPRATIALLRMARAMAVLDDRDFVTAKDVQEVLPDVLGHRVKLSSRTRAEGISLKDSMEQMCRNVKSPRT